MRFFAIGQSRNITLNTMDLLRPFLMCQRRVRIPKDGEYLFGGKLLDSVDTDITMHKRAKEVASRLANPRRDGTFSVRVLSPLFPPAAEGGHYNI